MDIFGILTMIGGLAMFLYGMNALGDGLAKLSGGKLERILERLTSHRFMAVLLGAAVTAVIQSSSATTVMVVGFVNSGIMKLTQAVGIIMGANVGTTITSWILSLTGIESSNVWVKLLKPSSFAPVLAIIGIIMILSAKENTKKQNIGNILVAFAILMFGMDTMSSAVKPLANNEQFTGILTTFSHPILGMIAGTVLTAVIQSSSASVGILQALCATGAVGYQSAIPIILGQNIGTCVTALISSVGANRNARRASMIHLYFNLIGTMVFLIVFYAINALVGGFSFLSLPAGPAGIAVIHSLFNIGAVAILYPFSNQLVRLSELTIPERVGENVEEPEALVKLDERFLEKPAFAMELCRNAAVRMAEEARTAIFLALENLKDYRDSNRTAIVAWEQEATHYAKMLGTYLVKLNQCDLSGEDSRTLSVLLHGISNFERISGLAVNITKAAERMRDKELVFSKKAREEINVLSGALHDVVAKSIAAFATGDLEKAKQVEPFAQKIDSLSFTIRQRHIKRVRKGKCTIELGFLLEDLVTDFERISDQCSNIAVFMLRVSEEEDDTHE